ncbi:hypothetical protein FDB55_16230 [Clostridium botulinum]|uniref:C2H2-type domain-containing protein n=1 Tax=Clostridium botulinum TaxID=1491 RepID=A0A846JXV5_CLOBO|nr:MULTISPECIES: hypothetical protein [Clostridium]KAI3349831.1 hypothetical protein CIT18_06100 [Clostridium botulinum]KOM87209.1 hypothetical protein ACP51_13475 [Clostridium botulinum]KOR55915.1 hypothetical protein ADT22_14580 [Clostridium botulinum]MBY7025598.1 hypothetical protein [Clostridium botulinum]MCS6112627.1 hypothetical protein [Clostridium botulinum]
MKKFLLWTAIAFVCLAYPPLNVFEDTNGSTHSWKITKANVDSGKVSYHEFNDIKDNCEIITYNSSYNKECTICGATCSEDSTAIFHLNSNCHECD